MQAASAPAGRACCGRYHAGAAAPTPEALLRGRFSAYSMQLVDYLVATTHPQNAEHTGDAITYARSVQGTARRTEFVGLTVLGQPDTPEEAAAAAAAGAGASQQDEEAAAAATSKQEAAANKASGSSSSSSKSSDDDAYLKFTVKWRQRGVGGPEEATTEGLEGFSTVPGPVHGWRCRAKLAVRGSAAAPQLGLFQANSHDLVPIPECRAHHPRINQAAQLVRQLAAALRVSPYSEPGSSSSSGGSSGGGSSSRRGGHLRYIQATVLPSKAGCRAEDDPGAQVQLVLVWAAPDASHPSAAEARRLAAALWSQAGPRQQQGAAALQASRMAQLRARAEAAAAAAARGGSGRPAKQQQRSKLTAASAAGNSGDEAAAAASRDARPLLHSVWLNFQPEDGSNTILGDSWLLLHGQQWGWQDFGGVPVAVAPGSFVQLYAGCGVIGLALAAQGAASKVVCIEVNPGSAAAFKATQAALARSKPPLVASAADPASLQRLLWGSDATVMVVDPPRKGLDAPLLQLLTAPKLSSNSKSSSSRPSSSSSGGDGKGRSSSSSSSSSRDGGLLPQLQRLIYLSCGFQALMGDTDALLAAGWRLSSCQAFFFFPGTDSIETLAVFDRQQ
ncbi:hypothetical protein COO60DRAFT_1644211 [Scenedesmus sp. NREL 46B-D3]|nr:hypothetical protein COO60DRAFT_1644211 [Scenedesmus sp. NREL 46B-D3]